MWNTLDHEICSTYMPQPLIVLCISVRDYILPGAKHGASCVSKVAYQFFFLIMCKSRARGLLVFFFQLTLVKRQGIKSS